MTVEWVPGKEPGSDDADYIEVGATVGDAPDVISASDILLCVQPPDETRQTVDPAGTHPDRPASTARRSGPRAEPRRGEADGAEPRRAAPVLSQCAGHGCPFVPGECGRLQAALVAAEVFSGYFPMLMTAAGTMRPAKVLVIGAGVAGLQAIGTARRLGAVVTG